MAPESRQTRFHRATPAQVHITCSFVIPARTAGEGGINAYADSFAWPAHNSHPPPPPPHQLLCASSSSFLAASTPSIHDYCSATANYRYCCATHTAAASYQPHFLQICTLFPPPPPLSLLLRLPHTTSGFFHLHLFPYFLHPTLPSPGTLPACRSMPARLGAASAPQPVAPPLAPALHTSFRCLDLL